jgi:hypothetical protein
MYTPVKHILPMTLIRRERVLPAPGKVLARAGQKVNVADVIAEANLYPEYLLIDVARTLHISAEKADRILQCQVGDQIAQADIIAGPIGLTRRLIRSPREGRVVLVGSGQVLLEIAGKPYQLKAGMPGEVVDLIPDRGVVIETGGALVQGVWGNGKIEFGAIRVLAQSPEFEVKAADLDVSLRGSITLAGYCQDEEVLKTAEELPLRGLIFSGMAARCIPQASRLSIPVIVLEGFGKYAYNPAAYKLLATNEQRPAAINAEMSASYSAARPEVIIPLAVPSSVGLPVEIAPLAANQTARLLRSPYSGETGVIVAHKGRVTFQSGLRAEAVEVRLENGQNVVVPIANLELIA